jgi:hypothetical protein
MSSETTHYRRSLEELHQVASKFWPIELSEQEAELSIIPTLLETQDDFIAILSVKVSGLEGIFTILAASEMSANLFLKHLAILADVGGEKLERFNNEFSDLFPDRVIHYLWNGNSHEYTFTQLPLGVGLSNKKLKIDRDGFFKPQTLDDLYKDVIALLLVGGASTDPNTANVLAKCEISDYLGQPDKLATFIKQRYIWVSRITGGATSNTLGQLAQQFVDKYIQDNLDIKKVKIKPNGKIPGITHTEAGDERETSFDLVISKGKKYVAVEVSFQVTTNSVIERKSGQARSRYQQIEAAGHRIAYILDGAGNFQRESALNTILSHSHCSVAFSPNELDLLCQFIREYLVLE